MKKTTLALALLLSACAAKNTTLTSYIFELQKLQPNTFPESCVPVTRYPGTAKTPATDSHWVFTIDCAKKSGNKKNEANQEVTIVPHDKALATMNVTGYIFTKAISKNSDAQLTKRLSSVNLQMPIKTISERKSHSLSGDGVRLFYVYE